MAHPPASPNLGLGFIVRDSGGGTDCLGTSVGPALGKFYSWSIRGLMNMGPKSEGVVAPNLAHIGLARLGI